VENRSSPDRIMLLAGLNMLYVASRGTKTL